MIHHPMECYPYEGTVIDVIADLGGHYFVIECEDGSIIYEDVANAFRFIEKKQNKKDKPPQILKSSNNLVRIK